MEVNKEKATVIGQSNRLIHWNVIKYAKEEGIKEYDMGGYHKTKTGDKQKDNIDFFKRSFGGDFTMHYIYEKNYSKLYKLDRKINEYIKSMKR